MEAYEALSTFTNLACACIIATIVTLPLFQAAFKKKLEEEAAEEERKARKIMRKLLAQVDANKIKEDKEKKEKEDGD